MKPKPYAFKTLQGRLIFLLLIPIFLIILTGGVLSFVYTRDVILAQWNESAVLKLQRAGHYLDMRLVRPVEMMEMLFDTAIKAKDRVSHEAILAHVKTMEGVLDIRYLPRNAHMGDLRTGSLSPGKGMMHFRHSRITSISRPVYNSDIGHETIELAVWAEDGQGHIKGQFIIKMSFAYLLKDIITLGWWQSDMACIVDQDGSYIAHTNMTMQGRHILGGENDPLELAILDQMRSRPNGTVKSPGHPPEMIAGFYKLAQVPWTIILFAKGKSVLAPIITYRNAFAMGSGLLILVIILLIRSHVGQILKQIRGLSENAQQVAKGNYGQPVAVTSGDEIGQLVTHYNAMVTGLKERDFIRDSFGRYVDPEFARNLLKHPDAGKLGGERREVVMMMSDIRGFTAMSETLSPEIIIRILNQYFSRMIAIIQDHNGIIVDFFGDAILVFFAPLSGNVPDTSLCAIQCAARMQAAMAGFNNKMKQEGLPALGMGIGIHSGPVIVGNIGSETRAKYGVVGSAVNITSRIQALAGAGEIIISEAVCHYTGEQVPIKRTFTAELKGVDEPARLNIIENII